MIRILVAEDDRALNGLVCSYLTDSGYSAVSCFDGKQALEALGKQPFDMIISDIMMPNVDGYELAKTVRETEGRSPFCL